MLTKFKKSFTTWLDSLVDRSTTPIASRLAKRSAYLLARQIIYDDLIEHYLQENPGLTAEDVEIVCTSTGTSIGIYARYVSNSHNLVRGK